MEAQGGVSIINISSVVGTYGNIGQANYSESKGAVVSLAKTWAKEFARKGVPVRVYAISPGYIMTDILKTVPQDLLDKFASMTMLGRLVEPGEIASVALFLASDDASYITGQNIVGWSTGGGVVSKTAGVLFTQKVDASSLRCIQRPMLETLKRVKVN